MNQMPRTIYFDNEVTPDQYRLLNWTLIDKGQSPHEADKQVRRVGLVSVIVVVGAVTGFLLQ